MNGFTASRTYRAEGFVGRTKTGALVWVKLETKHFTVVSRPNIESVEHEALSTYHRLSISGHSTSGSMGQILDELRQVDRPAVGWTMADVTALAGLWERWHLNDARPGCVHQRPQLGYDRYGTLRPSLLLTKACPVTGYRYGHGWLVEPLPGDVAAQVARFAGMLAESEGTDIELSDDAPPVEPDTGAIDSDEDVINSTDVIERIADLEQWHTGQILAGEELDEDEAHELAALRELAEQAGGVPDWEYGATLIRDSYFTEYAKDLAADIGNVRDMHWPYNHIDWEAAAEELQMDYTSVEFDGVTYWTR